MYKKDVGIVYAVNEMPQVAKIRAIYVVNSDKVLFKVQMMTTEYYIEHVRAYVVKFTSSDIALFSIHDLALPNPVHIRRKQVCILSYIVKAKH